MKVKLVRGKSSPWMTSTIRTSIKNRDFHLKKARRTNSERNLKVYRRLRNSVTNQIRSAKANYQRNLLKEEADNPKKFWDQIRKCYPSTSKTDKPPQSFQHNNTEITNKKDIANCFCSFFTHVGKNLQDSVVSISDRIWKDRNQITLNLKQINVKHHEFHFKEVQLKEVLKELKQIKKTKSAGIDQIPPTLLIDGAEEIAYVLTHLINRSLAI